MRRDRLFLADIIECCDKIDRYLREKSLEQFIADEVLVDATIRNLQNIGEAVRCLPEDTRNLRPEIEWTRIVGLRHLLVHHYFGIDEEIVWDLAANHCPQLRVAASDMLVQLPTE